MWDVRAAGMLALVAGALASSAGAYPVLGQANRWNHYSASLTEVYRDDFEREGPSITRDPDVVIAGGGSLRLSGQQEVFLFPADALNLAPSATYVVEYRYKVLRQDRPNGFNLVLFHSSRGPIGGLQTVPIAGARLGAPQSGTDTRGLRLPDASGITIGFSSLFSDLVIDDVVVYRVDVALEPGRVQLLKAGFPRLANYMLTSPSTQATLHSYPLETIERRVALADIVLGTDMDFTDDAIHYFVRLKRANPDILLLPYQQTFMTQYLDKRPVWGSSGLQALFNASLADEWFMYDTQGKVVISPPFPQNVQMNHTPSSPVVRGRSYLEHLVEYLSAAPFASGFFDGAHFDQPEWFLNPLLADSQGQFPTIDANMDGVPDTRAELDRGWADGFNKLFASLRERLGYGRLLFGNAGYISVNQTKLRYLNGWLREALEPYERLENGDWNYDQPSGWYKITRGYQTAMRNVQAPAIVALQYSGLGIGESTGVPTENGVPDRKPEPEPRDFRRIRLGLASTLLDDGFFEYDWVDNTTVPPWFDEYAVNAAGDPVEDQSGKGYLGQPLGDAVELSTPGTEVAVLDFEGTPDPRFQLGPTHRVTSLPGEVLSGRASLIASTNGRDFANNIFTTPGLRFEPGSIYQATMDFRVVDWVPSNFIGLPGLTLYTPGRDFPSGSSDIHYLPDIDGPGQSGTLRVVAKIAPDEQPTLSAYVLDRGTLIIDNVRITQGGPGVWRRDFEGGVVLVNPTPGPIVVPQDQVRGPLRRTGLRRIRGRQVPDWNNGQAVLQGIEIPQGDGIILLADRVSAAAPARVTGVTVKSATGSVEVAWSPAEGYVAGYLVRYGEDPSSQALELPVTRHHTRTEITGLAPGSRHYFSVAAYDYLGRIGPFSPVVSASTLGPAPARRPEFALSGSSVAPGAVAKLTGSNLAGSTATAPADSTVLSLAGAAALVNGVPCPLVAVSPGEIQFRVPSNAAGSTATLHVFNGVVLSRELVVPLTIVRR
jgi:hypothetical protein